MKGMVIRVNGAKMFGFIRGIDEHDYFFHKTDLNGFFEDL